MRTFPAPAPASCPRPLSDGRTLLARSPVEHRQRVERGASLSRARTAAPPAAFLVPLLCLSSLAVAQDDGAPEAALFTYVEGTIDASTAASWQEFVDTRREQIEGLTTIFVFIDSPGTEGGAIEPAIALAETIQGIRGVRKIAYIESSARASNAAALIALACHSLVVEPGAQLGYEENPETEVSDDREEDAKAAREAFATLPFFKQRDYPRALAEAMVSGYHETVVQATFRVRDRASGQMREKTEILTASELRNLPPGRAATLVKGSDRPVVNSGRRLTLTAENARDYRVAERTVGGIDDALLQLDLDVADQRIFDQKQGVRKPDRGVGATLVRFLNHFVVRFVLLTAAFVLLFLEVKMPGTFVPLLASGACFVVFFAAGFFGVDGAPPTTHFYELALFVVGLGLLAVELFLLPGVLVFGLLGGGAMLTGLVFAMVPPESVRGVDTLRPREAFGLLVMALGVSFAALMLVARYVPRSRWLARSGLVTRSVVASLPGSDDVLAAQSERDRLVGEVGTALTPLHPAGKIELGDELIDVVAEGDYIDAGATVRILEATPFRCVVRRVDPPPADPAPPVPPADETPEGDGPAGSGSADPSSPGP